MASKQDYSNFVTELNQSSLKPCPEDGRYGRGIYARENTYICKNFGVKEGGGRLLEGDVFLEIYGCLTKRLEKWVHSLSW